MPKFKTRTAALAHSFLQGEILTIADCFRRFSISNLPREASRSIEDKFGLSLSRDKVDYKSTEGWPGYYYTYRLNKSRQTKESLELAWKYVEANMITPNEQAIEPKKEEKILLYREQTLF
jgi:hypothetical protein